MWVEGRSCPHPRVLPGVRGGHTEDAPLYPVSLPLSLLVTPVNLHVNSRHTTKPSYQLSAGYAADPLVAR